MYSKGTRCVQVIGVYGSQSATTGWAVVRVARLLGRKVARIKRPGDERESSLLFDPATGLEVDPAIPGCSARIIVEDGQ